MLKIIRFFINKVQSSKYIRKGHCKQCGSCCRNIAFLIKDKPVSTEEQFELMKQMNRHYKNFFISGRDNDNALLFTCRELDENNRCKVYHFRGLLCRLYPNPNSSFIANGGTMRDNCGFYFEVDRNFSSYVKIDKKQTK